MRICTIYIIFLILNLTECYTLNGVSLKKKTNISKEIDNKILKLGKPAVLNNLMIPITGLVDTFWVSNKGTAIDLAAVGMADQIFFIFFSVFSFMPIILTPKITSLHINKQKYEISNLVKISIKMILFFSLLSSVLIFKSDDIVNIFVKGDKDVKIKAVNYLKYRSVSIPFCLFNNLIFGVMRGIMDYTSAIKINILSQFVNIILDPILINISGIKGAAIATVYSDILCTLGYTYLLYKKNIINLNQKITDFVPIAKRLFKLGFMIQLRLFLLQIVYIFMNRKILLFDSTGVSMASHIIICKMLNISEILYKGLAMTSSSIIPLEQQNMNDKLVKKRILYFTNIVSLLLALIYNNNNKFLYFLTNDNEVIKNINSLTKLSIIYLCSSGYATVLEGLLQGHQKIILPSIVSLIMYLPMFLLINKATNLIEIWKYSGFLLIIKNLIYFLFLNKIEEKSKKRIIENHM